MSAVRHLALLPYHSLALFSGAKSFKANPVIGAPWLNRLGLHVIRLVVANAIFAFRQWPLGFAVAGGDRRSYTRDGYLVKENFLPADLFADILAEVQAYRGDARQCVQGDTVTWRVFLGEEVLRSRPALTRLARYQPYLDLLKYASARNERPWLYIQKVWNRCRKAAPDPQKNLHSDTFHPTMKAWLFLQDVGEGEGTFMYVPGSHRMNLRRLRWEYRRSLVARTLKDGYSAKGSFRLDEADRAQLGLPPAKTFVVKANTLVIADTHGFHARGPVTGENVARLEIWAYSRVNPFNPWMGFNTRIARRIRETLFDCYMDYKDRRAAAKGKPASWRLVRESSVHRLQL